jgi:hypothetical protein
MWITAVGVLDVCNMYKAGIVVSLNLIGAHR